MKIDIPNRTLILVLILLAVTLFADHLRRSETTANGFSASSNPALARTISTGIRITDAKMATGLDDQLMPVNPTDVFPRNTQRVYCWFSWEGAVPQTEVKADWNYAIDDVHILTYSFRIPRKKGAGGISLLMPTGKVLPVGSYRVDLAVKNQVVQSLSFKVK